MKEFRDDLLTHLLSLLLRVRRMSMRVYAADDWPVSAMIVLLS
ncbi:MAG: hypothetical protein ABL961_04250 [Vicinamibacterales bacterium]